MIGPHTKPGRALGWRSAHYQAIDGDRGELGADFEPSPSLRSVKVLSVHHDVLALCERDFSLLKMRGANRLAHRGEARPNERLTSSPVP